MSLVVNLKKIGEITGMKTGDLSNYVKRNKLIRNEDGEFDLSEEINVRFLEKRGVNLDLSIGNAVSKAAIESDDDAENDIQALKQKKKEVKSKYVEEKVAVSSGQTITEIERTIKTLQAHKLKREISVYDFKIDKLKGEVIPTELVYLVLSQQFKSAAMAFKNGVDRFISVIAKEVEFDSEKRNSLRLELINVVNTAVEESVNESKKQIKEIVNEYSEARGKGERK